MSVLRLLAVLALISVMSLLAFPALARAESASHTFGVGLIFGDPTGISGKLWLSNKHAVDMGAAWAVGTKHHRAAFDLHADYLYHFDVIHVSRGRLPLYAGIGGRVILANEASVGVRIPLGITYLFADAPFDIFLELAPIMDLVPSTAFDANAGFGARFYF